tara:strand:+ start:5543 stop:6322 length:780 start_codon:yes stop_codon:yes gene_type:complete
MSSAAASQSAKVPQAAWRPTPFTGAIPAGYSGENADQFLRVLLAAPKVKKDEFETTADFEARSAKAIPQISPIDPGAAYAFRLPVSATYDADSQSYKIDTQYGCGPSGYAFMGDSPILCTILERVERQGSYNASNAFGANANVTKVLNTKISITLPKAVLSRRDLFRKVGIGLDNSYTLDHRIYIPINKAAAFRGKNIQAIFVGSIVSANVVIGRGMHAGPSVGSPYEITGREIGLPFAPSKVLFYVVETGEILEAIDL